MQDMESKTRTYYVEVFARIEMQQADFPDGKFGEAIANKIRTKVFCNRENIKLVEMKTNEYEGAINRDEEN